MTEPDCGSQAIGHSPSSRSEGRPPGGLVRFAFALIISALLLSADLIWLRRCIWIDHRLVPGIDQLEPLLLFNPCMLIPAFASAVALIAGAVLSDISGKRRTLLAVAALLVLAALVFAWQELASFPEDLLKAIAYHLPYDGLESIRQWTFASSLQTVGPVLVPVTGLILLVKFVARPWAAKRQSSSKPVTPVILVSVAVVLLLLRYAVASIQNVAGPKAGVPEFRFGVFGLLMMGTFSGCLAVAAFQPKRFWIAVLFSAVVALAGYAGESGLTSHRHADLPPTFYAVFFSVFFLPVAFLLRPNSQPPHEKQESGLRLVLAASPAFLVGLFFWMASSRVDFPVLAYTRDYTLARLASEATRCRVLVDHYRNQLEYFDESRADFPARILPLLVEYRKNRATGPTTVPARIPTLPAGSLSMRKFTSSIIPDGIWVEYDFAPLMHDRYPGDQFDIVRLDRFQVSNAEQAGLLAGLGRERQMTIDRIDLGGTAQDYESWKGEPFVLDCSNLSISGAASLLPTILQTGMLPSNSNMSVSIDCTECDLSAKEFVAALRVVGNLGDLSLMFTDTNLTTCWTIEDLQFDDPVWKNCTIMALVDGDGKLPGWLAELILCEPDRPWPSVELGPGRTGN